jgi:hypothetical protein
LDLVDAAVQRQDDLRNMNFQHITAQRESSERHIDEVANLRAQFNEKLRDAETSRLNAIRQVDRDTVARAAEVQTTAATTLANQVATSADAVRLNLDTKVAPILEAIAALQRAQYETAGGTQQKVESRADTGSRGMWIGLIVAFGGVLSTGFLGTAAIAVTLLPRK